MIKYRLECDHDHAFDAWFPSSASFDAQAQRKLVTCPDCGSTAVRKALMAPAVQGGRRDLVPTAGAEPQATGPRPVATLPAPRTEAERELLALMRRVRDEVRQNADYVGPRFAEEARRIHDNEAPQRGIYGEASFEDARQLREEGIDVFPLPVLPDDHN